MSGFDIPHTPICIDLWDFRKYPVKRFFFLTHAHADHIQGLSPAWKHTIYCSELTAKFVQKIKGVQKQYFTTLEVGTEHILNINSSGSETFSVKFIDANHCPGAVMILLQGYFGSILATGDFRYSPKMMEDLSLNKCCVDTLYLDNTYNNPMYRTFPTTESVCEQAVEIILSHPSASRVYIGDYLIGKESLLCAIAKAAQERICVEPLRFECLGMQGLPDFFTADPSSSRLHAVSMSSLPRVVRQLSKKDDGNALVLIPSGRADVLFEEVRQAGLPAAQIFKLYYSEHCSFTELQQFVSQIRPKVIIPFVKTVSMPRVDDASHFDKYLDPRPLPLYNAPEICHVNNTKRKAVLQRPAFKPSMRKEFEYGSPAKSKKSSAASPVSHSCLYLDEQFTLVTEKALFSVPEKEPSGSESLLSCQQKRHTIEERVAASCQELSISDVLVFGSRRNAPESENPAASNREQEQNSERPCLSSPEADLPSNEPVLSVREEEVVFDEPALSHQQDELFSRWSIYLQNRPAPHPRAAPTDERPSSNDSVISEADVFFDAHSDILPPDNTSSPNRCCDLDVLTTCTVTPSGELVATCACQLLHKFSATCPVPMVLLPTGCLPERQALSKNQMNCAYCTAIRHPRKWPKTVWQQMQELMQSLAVPYQTHPAAVCSTAGVKTASRVHKRTSPRSTAGKRAGGTARRTRPLLNLEHAILLTPS